MAAIRRVRNRYTIDLPTSDLLTALGVDEPVQLREVHYGDDDRADTVTFVVEGIDKPA